MTATEAFRTHLVNPRETLTTRQANLTTTVLTACTRADNHARADRPDTQYTDPGVLAWMTVIAEPAVAAAQALEHAKALLATDRAAPVSTLANVSRGPSPIGRYLLPPTAWAIARDHVYAMVTDYLNFAEQCGDDITVLTNAARAAGWDKDIAAAAFNTHQD